VRFLDPGRGAVPVKRRGHPFRFRRCPCGDRAWENAPHRLRPPSGSSMDRADAAAATLHGYDPPFTRRLYSDECDGSSCVSRL